MFKRSVQGIVFDLDGTLIDSAPDLAIATNEMLQKHGLDALSEPQVRQWIGNGMPTLVQRAFAHYHEVVPDGALDCFFAAYAENSSKLSKLYPGVRETLQFLRAEQTPLALVTNKAERFLPTLLADFDLAQYFSIVVGGDTFDKKKPDPEALLYVAKRWHVEPEHLLMVGDSTNDIRAGKAAGG